VRPDREEELGAGGDQDQLRLPVLGVGDDVAAAPHALGGGVAGAVEDRHVLAGKDQGDGIVRAADGQPPGLGHLVGVAGPDHVEVGDRAQPGQLLDRLVSGPVSPRPNRVVGEEV